jgi:hypothetical protein
MTITPPRRFTPTFWTNPAAALDYEIAQEKASTLGRLGRALEAALAALRDFDTQPREAGQPKQERRALVAEAGHALWMFVVQREALGLRDSRQLMRDYGVPPEVQGRMGMLPEKSRR